MVLIKVHALIEDKDEEEKEFLGKFRKRVKYVEPVEESGHVDCRRF